MKLAYQSSQLYFFMRSSRNSHWLFRFLEVRQSQLISLAACTNLTASVPREHIFIGTSHSDADISPCRLSVMDLCATDRLRSRGQNRIEE